MTAIVAAPPTIYQDAFFSSMRATNSLIVTTEFEYIDMKGGPIINVSEPINNSDVATKYYVDTHGGGGGGNLSGPITATGGVTSITSQTGSGTTFVMNTSPILVTPNIGNASAISLDVTSNISVTGQITSFNTTQSNSSSTGSITTFGGIAAQKNIFSGGTCHAIDFISTSDRRMKKNIKNIDYDDVVKFLKVKGYTYNLNDEPGIRYGVIAQDLEDIGLGVLVDNTTDHKKVSYQSLIPLMIETIKSMERKIECNNAKILILTKQMEKLERNVRKTDSVRKKRLSVRKK